MGKKIVIALGGNALGNNLPEQMAAVKETAKAIADLIEEGHEVVISHGNGPQVGMINLAMGELAKADPDNPVAPLSVCVAMSQGYIGYDLQNALREELLNRGIHKPVASLITQMRVDPEDEAFKNPTKPIGRFMTREEADEMVAERGYDIKEDAGRGYRRVVASPKPVEIIEIETVRSLIEDGQVVIAAGGGGIPVYAQGNHLKGAAAVVDKDFGSSLLAQEINADWLIILTAVEKVAINFGKEDQENLASLTPEQAQVYIKEGQFAPGSMLPKVEAAVEFAESGEGRQSLITLLEKARDGINGKTGTVIRRA
ncbi:MAG: carbamate kinase [Eubacteriaceae bacterium]|jgi:carbamate kinase